MQRSFRLALCGALAASAAALTVPAASAQPSSVQRESAPATDPVARGVIVKTTASDTTLERVTDGALDGDAQVGATDEVGRDVVAVRFDEILPTERADEVAAELAERPDVEWAVPDRRARSTAQAPVRPQDPMFGEQHNLWDSRTAAAGGWSVKAPALWRSTKGSREAVVAVIDTGVVTTHPDLAPNLVPGHDMVDLEGVPGVDPFYTANDGDGRDADPSDPGDWVPVGDTYCYGERTTKLERSSWHGTHVAGIVAAAENGAGVVGVAPGVRIQPVRALGRCGGWDSDIHAAITWASGGHVEGVPDNATPADVINMSIGRVEPSAKDAREVCEAYDDVVAAARKRGTLVLAAAGNSFGSAALSVPGACPGVMTVASTSEVGRLAHYSNVGKAVEIAAPGGDAKYGGQGILSTYDTGATRPVGHTWARRSGTSMATPAVAAGAALLVSLGVEGPDRLEKALRAATAPFPKASSTYAKKALMGPKGRVTRNLNCTTSLCGAGILDLAEVPAPVGTPKVSGPLVIGESVSVRGTWTTSTALRHQWLRDGRPLSGATAATYTVTRADVGKRLSVRSTPTSATWTGIEATSAVSAVVPDGPTVTLAGLPSRATYAGAATAVTVSVSDGDTPVAGPVELRRGSTVLAAGTAGEDGIARLSVRGTAWLAGANGVRAAFLGSTDVPAASSTTTTVTVAKATAAVRQSIASTIKRTAKPKLTAVVTVPGVVGPTGTLKVYAGSKRLVTKTLTAGAKGRLAITLPKLKKGKHRIKTVYSGSSVVAGKTSSVKTVRSR